MKGYQALPPYEESSRRAPSKSWRDTQFPFGFKQQGYGFISM
jgi:hypothetical protein